MGHIDSLQEIVESSPSPSIMCQTFLDTVGPVALPLQDPVKASVSFEVVEKEKPEGGTKNKPYFVWGIIASYELHLGSWSLAPTLYLDFVGETKTNLTYGVTIGTGF